MPSSFLSLQHPRFARAVRPILLALLVALTGAAQAEDSDRMQPLNFSADAARVDQVKQLNILEGHVEITKGSMVLRADRVEVQQNSDGSQTARASGGNGGRSYFRQRRDAVVDEMIEGEADRIDYDGHNNLVKFVGHASMRRLQGSTVADEVSGNTVVYDNTAQTFQVLGGGSSTAAQGRVRGVLTPKPQEPAAAPRRAASGVTP